MIRRRAFTGVVLELGAADELLGASEATTSSASTSSILVADALLPSCLVARRIATHFLS